MPFPATDSFAGTGALSGSWTVDIGTASRVADQLVGVIAVDEVVIRWTAETPSADQYSQVVYISGQPGPMVRMSANQGYALIPNVGGGTRIYNYNAGAYTNLDSYAVTCANGDVLRLEAVGNVLSFYKNGAFIGDVINAAYGSGQIGIFCAANSTADDWEGGSIGAATFKPAWASQANSVMQ